MANAKTATKAATPATAPAPAPAPQAAPAAPKADRRRGPRKMSISRAAEKLLNARRTERDVLAQLSEADRDLVLKIVDLQA